MNTPQPARPTNTQTIARNSVWYGIEIFFSLFSTFVTSVLVARVVGPHRLGYFQYVVWLTNITTTLGTFGLPMTTRKYMAECLNRDQAEIAHAIYRTSLRIQILITAGVTGAGLVPVFWLGDPAYRLISAILVLNMAPRMIGFIPSQANNAAELMKRSTGPALVGGCVNVGLTLFSLWIGWDLPGVAFSFLAGSGIEAGLKLIDVRRRLAPVAVGELPPALRKRMLSYSGQGLALMLLNVIVWDRSDLIILKNMNPDITQVTFFSIAFNLTERVLMIPNAFGASLGVTMMAQYGRGEERLNRLVVSGTKYALLLALPLLTGLACMTRPVVLLYGHGYEPLAPVLTLVALMALPKALTTAPTALLQTTENQGFLIWANCVCGALDILLDFLWTPAYGARGAALANGLAQTAAAIAVWGRAYYLFRMDLMLGEFGRVVVSGILMSGVTLLVGHSVPGYTGLVLAFCCGCATWFVSVKATRAFSRTDAERLLVVGKALPWQLRKGFTRFVGWLSVERREAASGGASL